MTDFSTAEKFIRHLDSLETKDLRAFIRKLAEEKALMGGITDSISEGILVIGPDQKIRYRNTAATAILGIPEDCSRLSISQILKGVDWPGLLERKERSARHEMEILYPERRIIRFYVVPHPECRASTVILSDVTQEFDQNESRMAMERGKMVSLLAAGVAHEIGNPLNSLSLNLQYLQRMLERGTLDSAEALESVKASKKEVERLDGIISRFLKAVRPSRLHFMDLDVQELLTESLNFMQHEIEDRSVRVVCSFPPVLPRIQADPNQLKQAFYNLFRNALQAMPGGGTLTISCTEEEDSLFVEVADTGNGIPAEQMKHIFQPFYTTKESGNGLGLMIVERIIREHGGRLSVESSAGQGTRFILGFPLRRNKVRVLPPAPGDGKDVLA